MKNTDTPSLEKWLKFFYMICALLILADFIPLLLPSEEAADDGSTWQSSWGFYGIYGFTACVILVIAAKGLRKLVMRPEDYYDKKL
ncbi:hypothetical protein [Dasania marina]|uniref:hypothetical protein n=1 Tax=Dasania marina TaxID=471499 RepID=UPI00037FEEDE|nr:hypothetical protein [Dasania marina]